MLRIRLMRIGRRNRPQYRIVVTDSRKPRESRYQEAIGFYDPLPDPSVCRVQLGRYDYWLNHGAKPSNTVLKLVKIARSQEDSSSDASRDKEQT